MLATKFYFEIEDKKIDLGTGIVQIIFATWCWEASIWQLCEGFTNRRFSCTPCACEILLPYAENETYFIRLYN